MIKPAPTESLTKPRTRADPSPAKYIPLLLVLFALALRLWGITWALPDATRYYSYHVDESVVVGHALDLDPLAGRIEPNFYNYGSLPLLLDGMVIHAGRGAGLIPANDPALRPGGLAVPSATELLTARLLTAFFGAGTVGLLYGTGRLLYSREAGIVAGAAYAVAPLAVQHGHFATVDVGAVFWLTGSLYFAARHLAVLTPTPPPLAPGRSPAVMLFLCGLFAGLAGAAKYNFVLVVLSGAVAWWLAAPRKPLPLALLGIGTALGFLIGCPGIVLNPGAVIRDVTFEARHVATGHGEVFTDTLPGFIYHVVFNLRWGLTVPLLILCLFGIGVAVARRRPPDAVLAAFAFPYYLLIGLAAVKFARYTLPLFPPLFLLAGGAWHGWKTSRVGMAYRSFAVIAGVSALGFSVALDQVITRPDARDQAAAYIHSLPGIQTVGFSAGPWYYSPPLNPFLAHPYPLVPQEASLQSNVPRLVASIRYGADGEPDRDEHNFPRPEEWSVPLLSASGPPDAIVFGEIHYNDWLRARFAPAETYLIEAEKRYPDHKNFTNPVTLFGLPLVPIYTEPNTPWHGLPTQTLPHDMLYTNPSVSVWTR